MQEIVMTAEETLSEQILITEKAAKQSKLLSAIYIVEKMIAL